MSRGALGTNVISQICLVVRDIAKTAAAWADLLGVEAPAIRLTDPAEKTQARYRGKATQARARLAFFQVGPQLSLELIEPVGGPSTWQEFLDSHGEGVHHVAFRVEGMDEKLADIASGGIHVVQRGDFTGGRYAYVDSADKLKVILELLESLPARK